MLTVFREGVRIEASQMTFKAAVPTWEARYEELKEVAAVGTAPFRPGVRLYVNPASNGLMIFYTWGRRGLLNLLAAQGVHMRRKPVRFFYARLPRAPRQCRRNGLGGHIIGIPVRHPRGCWPTVESAHTRRSGRVDARVKTGFGRT